MRDAQNIRRWDFLSHKTRSLLRGAGPVPTVTIVPNRESTTMNFLKRSPAATSDGDRVKAASPRMVSPVGVAEMDDADEMYHQLFALDVEHIEKQTEPLNDTAARPALMRIVKELIQERKNLRQNLAESAEKLADAKADLDRVDREDRERTATFVRYLEKVTTPETASAGETSVHSEDTVALGPGQIPSSEQATELVVQSLLAKINGLLNTVETLTHENAGLYERVQDLSSENEAHETKIVVLESQFKTINKTRQKVVSRLMNRASLSIANNTNVGGRCGNEGNRKNNDSEETKSVTEEESK